jgi:hypothetical protein
MTMMIIIVVIIVVVMMAFIPLPAFPPTMTVPVAVPMPTGRHGMMRGDRTMRRLDIGWRLSFHVFPGECPLRDR